MSKIYYELQLDCNTVVFSAMKNPVGKCINNCWFCSRSNKFLDIEDYHRFNKDRLVKSLEILKEKAKNNSNLVIFDYGVNFTHRFSESLVHEFEECIDFFIKETHDIKNIYFRLCIVDDLLLKNSTDVLLQYLEAIIPIYNKISFEKEIKMTFSFDFDSRLISSERSSLFLDNYLKMLALQNEGYSIKNKISYNNLATILLAKTVKFVNENWTKDNFVITTFKECLAQNSNVAICLPWPMNLDILRSKNSTRFCNDYCYLTVAELLKFNKLLGITECPYILGELTEGLFFCELNGGCKNKMYCKQYLLGKSNVNL